MSYNYYSYYGQNNEETSNSWNRYRIDSNYLQHFYAPSYFHTDYSNIYTDWKPPASRPNYFDKRNLGTQKTQEEIYESDNELIKLLKTFPNKNWNYIDLSKNPNIKLSYVKQHNKYWDWYHLSSNPGITFNDILTNPDFNWNSKNVLKNPNTTMEHILNNYTTIENMDLLLPDFFNEENNIIQESAKKILTRDEIWSISENPSITINDMEKNKDSLPVSEWSLYFLSKNPNINIEFVLNNDIKSFDWTCLSMNKGITCEDIENNPNLPWMWTWISQNPNINIDFVLKNLDKKWDYKFLTKNPGIKIEDILNHSELKWDMKSNVFLNPNLNKSHLNWCHELIITNKYKLGNSFDSWIDVVANPGITIEDIISYNEMMAIKYANWISKNPNITYNFIKLHPNFAFDWNALSNNMFDLHPYVTSNICYL